MRPSRSARLRALFPLLVATAASATACGASTDTSHEPPATPTPNPAFPLLSRCPPPGDPGWDFATPAPEYDGFEMRRRADTETYVVKKTFAPLCTKAKDRAACNATASAVDGEGFDPEAFSSAGPRLAQDVIIVNTRADSVGVVRTIEELGAALAPVQTPEEALLLAGLRSYHATCAADGTAYAARSTGDGFDLLVRRGGECGSAVVEATVHVSASGAFSVVDERQVEPPSTGGSVCGRRPEGLAPLDAPVPEGLAGMLARMAWLEAASVPAFASLARDLARHGAPDDLVTRALAARTDEITHARLTRRAARKHGGRPAPPRIRPAHPRTLFELALENAVEGCVREAFGALVATHQAQHATDAELASMFAAIAKDETEHAALSLDLAEWLAPLLTTEEHEQLAHARDSAFAELERELATEPSLDERTRGGMPSRATSRRLLAALRALDTERS